MSSMRPDNILIGFGGALAAGKDTVAKRLGDFIEADFESVREFEDPTAGSYTILGMSDVLKDAIMVISPWVVVPSDFKFFEDAGLNYKVTRHMEGDTFGRYDMLLSSVENVLQDHTEFKGNYESEAYTIMKRVPDVRKFLQRLGTEVGRNLLYENVWVDVASRRITEALQRGHVFITGIRFPNELEMIRNLGGLSVYVDRKLESSEPHSSETSIGVDDFDTVVNNCGTLAELDKFIIPTFGNLITALWKGSTS